MRTIRFATFTLCGLAAFGILRVDAQVRTAKPELRLVPQLGHFGEILDMYFVKKDEFLFTSGGYGQAILWDVRTGSEIREFRDCPAELCRITSDARYLVHAGHQFQTVVIEDWNSGREPQELETGEFAGMTNTDRDVRILNFDKARQIYEVRDVIQGSAAYQWVRQPGEGGRLDSTFPRWSRNGERLAVCGTTEGLKVLNARTGSAIFSRPNDRCDSWTISPDGRMVAVFLVSNRRPTIHVWSIDSANADPVYRWEGSWTH
jgi:WD40 repeat protein